MSSATETPLVDRFTELERRLADEGPQWLREMRKEGRRRFEEAGIPAANDEAWRNTNLTPLTQTRFAPVSDVARDIERPALARLELGGPRLVFIDGRLVEASGEVPSGVWVGTLRRALEEIPDRVQPLIAGSPTGAAEAFHSLNDALWEDGALVLVDDGVQLEAPIELVYLSGASAEPTATHPRTLVSVGARASAHVVESYLALQPTVYWTNAVTHTVVGDGGKLSHVRLQAESPEAYHLATLHSRQGRDTLLTQHNLVLGARLARNDVTGVIDGEGAYGHLLGLYVTRHRQHVDNHTILDHARPHGDSREVYKGILADDSRAVFTGRIIVRPDSQLTDAKQSNPNLLLSPSALAHTRPQLEIYADDVKCTHGATIGQMDADAIFYLQSRGISRAEARNLLIGAFAGEVLESIEPAPLREAVSRLVADRLPTPEELAG